MLAHTYPAEVLTESKADSLPLSHCEMTVMWVRLITVRLMIDSVSAIRTAAPAAAQNKAFKGPAATRGSFQSSYFKPSKNVITNPPPFPRCFLVFTQVE